MLVHDIVGPADSPGAAIVFVHRMYTLTEHNQFPGKLRPHQKLPQQTILVCLLFSRQLCAYRRRCSDSPFFERYNPDHVPRNSRLSALSPTITQIERLVMFVNWIEY